LTYLFDVNVLLALAYPEHVHHRRVFAWVNTLYGNEFATCAITELAFVRIASGRVAFTAGVDSAKSDLARLKKFGHFVFLGDWRGVEFLPRWVHKSSQTTDGHLLDLAASYGAQLATLDRGIPGADLIPELPEEASAFGEQGRAPDAGTSDTSARPPREGMQSLAMQ
jgi:toxin-antitoxin system PIN domain toxin